MAFGKWNTSGETTWTDDDVLMATDLNDTFDGTIPPIGSIMGWTKSFGGVPQTIPTGWMECDGSTIDDADSPMDNTTVPDLTGGQLTRGNSTSGGTGGGDTHTHGVQAGGGYGHNGNSRIHSTENSVPPYYEVVWIIRFK